MDRLEGTGLSGQEEIVVPTGLRTAATNAAILGERIGTIKLSDAFRGRAVAV